jgi:hypothetical protein
MQKKIKQMKKLLTLVILCISLGVNAQTKFFHLYLDSAILVQDANFIVADFSANLNAISPIFSSQPKAILNTKPFLIFYSPKSNLVNLPIWDQVIPQQKEFFYKLGGNKKKGKEIFGLFFNGFYLSHELGHAIQNAANKRESNLFQNEYFANTIAILYWRKVMRTKELRQCYKYAKQMVRQLPNPVPQGVDPIKYFNEHYQELGADPYKYGYYQFAQFVEIYENKTLQNFDEFIRKFLAK